MSRTICGECEQFDPDYDPYGLFDGYCDLYERGRNKNSESVTHPPYQRDELVKAWLISLSAMRTTLDGNI